MAKQQTGFKVEIIPDVYTLGLFKKTLASRKRLRVTTGIAVVVLWTLFAVLSWFLRHVSEWPTVNLVLLIALMGGVLMTAYLVALTVGDAFFPGPWREKMRLGDRFTPESVEDQAALLRNKNVYFILTWFLAILAVLFGSNAISGSTITWYSSKGSILTSLRCKEAADRLSALKIITNPLKMSAWEDPDIRAEVVKLIDDSNTEIAALAAYVAGRAQIPEAAEPSMRVVQNTALDAHLRAEAAITLGRLDWKPARGTLISTLNQAFAQDANSTELVPSLIYAFYDMKDVLAVQPVTQMLTTCMNEACSDDILQYAFFYLKSMRATQGVPVAFEYIDHTELPAKTRCLAADALRFISTPNDVPAMKVRFEKASMEESCDDIYRKYHQEAAIQLFEHDPIRALYVRAVGNHMQKADYDWIWVIGSDTKENINTRKVAELYTKAMNAKLK